MTEPQTELVFNELQTKQVTSAIENSLTHNALFKDFLEWEISVVHSDNLQPSAVSSNHDTVPDLYFELKLIRKNDNQVKLKCLFTLNLKQDTKIPTRVFEEIALFFFVAPTFLYAPLHLFKNSNTCDKKSLVEEFLLRGYDLSSLKFSIDVAPTALTGVKKHNPKPGRLRPGVLWSQWGYDELPYKSSMDLMCYWHIPCSKRDSNLFFYHNSFIFRPDSFDTTLKKLGLNRNTFYFEIKHKTKTAKKKKNATLLALFNEAYSIKSNSDSLPTSSIVTE